MNEPVRIPRSLAIQLLDHARQHPDDEVCGLIAQGSDGSLRTLRVPNVAQDRSRHFEMDAQVLARAQRSMREAGQALWAVYHSHPEAGAEPSPRDLALNGAPEVLQLIVSLDIRGVLQLRAWRFDPAGPQEVTLAVE